MTNEFTKPIPDKLDIDVQNMSQEDLHAAMMSGNLQAAEYSGSEFAKPIALKIDLDVMSMPYDLFQSLRKGFLNTMQYRTRGRSKTAYPGPTKDAFTMNDAEFAEEKRRMSGFRSF